MHLLATYAPGSFTRPMLIVSTSIHMDDVTGELEGERETAIVFVDALNEHNALSMMYLTNKKVSGFIVIQKHQTKDEAIKFFMDMANKLSYDNTDEEMGHREVYHELYLKYCPDHLRSNYTRPRTKKTKKVKKDDQEH